MLKYYLPQLSIRLCRFVALLTKDVVINAQTDRETDVLRYVLFQYNYVTITARVTTDRNDHNVL